MHALIEGMLETFQNNDFDNLHALKEFSAGDSYDDLSALFMSIAEHSDSELYDGGYSGRNMYGKYCWAIRTTDIVGVIEVAAQHGVTCAKYDSLGMASVVYWPKITYQAFLAGQD
jgi:hypothetical protein